MRRIRFKGKNAQRKFFDLVILRLNSPSLRGILQFGLEVNYSTLKNYYVGARLISEDFFNDLCLVSNIRKDEIDFEFLEDNWGKVLGGRKSKRLKGANTRKF